MSSLLSPMAYIKRKAGTTCALASALGSGLGTFPVSVALGETRWFAHISLGDAAVYRYSANDGTLTIYSEDCSTLVVGPSNPVSNPAAANSRIKVDNSGGAAAVTLITVQVGP